jgi:hypothetical protein
MVSNPGASVTDLRQSVKLRFEVVGTAAPLQSPPHKQDIGKLIIRPAGENASVAHGVAIQ